MKLIPLASALALSTMLSTSVAASPLESFDQKLSYILGQNFAQQLKRDDINLDFDAFRLAIEEEMKGKKSSLTEEQRRKTVLEYQMVQQAKQARQSEVAAARSEENKKAGQEYLAANAKKEGVVVTSSGLQYKEVIAGNGAIPTAGQRVKVHYHGTLIDGTVFDSSYDRGAPATFGVTQVIRGWVEALQLMNVGDKFELAIPSELAYGESGAGGKIGPGMTLLFDVELLEIVK